MQTTSSTLALRETELALFILSAKKRTEVDTVPLMCAYGTSKQPRSAARNSFRFVMSKISTFFFLNS